MTASAIVLLQYICMFCFPNTYSRELFFFQISSYARAYVGIIYEKTEGQVPLGPLFGKQNIQAKEVYSLSLTGRYNLWHKYSPKK